MPTTEERPIILEARNVSYSYPDPDGADALPAVNNISLTIREGEYVCLLGHNGSGKSTLAKLLNLVLVPDSGEIRIRGTKVDFEKMTEAELFDVRRTVGMVFQNPDDQLVATIVEEDVAFGPENLGIAPDEIRRRVDESLALVGMSEFADCAPHALSGGQKQRVAIAGVLAMKPRCIIFDESTAMLDPGGRKDVCAIIDRLHREENITVVSVTHHMDETVGADRIIVMDDGRITDEGTPAEVFSKVGELRACALESPAGTELLYDLNGCGAHFDLPALDFDTAASQIAAEYKRRKDCHGKD